MSTEQTTKRWLQSKARSHNGNSNTDIAIKCFPYGMTSNLDGRLDLAQDYLATGGPYRISVLILFLVIFTAFALLYPALLQQLFNAILSKEPIAMAGLALMALFAILTFSTISFVVNRQSFFHHDFLKIKSLIATPQALHFILLSAKDLSVPWSAIENIQLLTPSENKTRRLALVLSGKSLKQPLPITITALQTYENWLLLKQVIGNYAPHIKLDEKIDRAFVIASTDTSFTDIWLESLTQAPEENALLDLTSDTTLNHGKYQIIEPIDSGGQGHAYLAKETATAREVVIKEYLLPIYQNKQIIDRATRALEAEAIILQRIDHPHIVKFIDWFSQDNCAFLVLERVSGENLKTWCSRKGRPSQPQIRNLVKQMCQILEYLHSFTPPIIHRDFTPDNLIIDEQNRLTLIDFTLAEPSGNVSGLPPSGKPAYMPPEQFRGETSRQSDLYALGGTLFYLLTACDPEALEQPLLTDNTIDETLRTIVHKCRAQSPQERFQKAEEIQRLLE